MFEVKDPTGALKTAGAGGGGVSGTGVAAQVALWSTASALGGNSGLSYASGTLFSGDTTYSYMGGVLNANAPSQPVFGGSCHVNIGATDAVGVNKGGSIGFYAVGNASTAATVASISGRRESAVATVNSGYIVFAVNRTGTLLEACRIDSAGQLSFASVAPVTGGGYVQFPAGETVAGGVSWVDTFLYRKGANNLAVSGAAAADTLLNVSRSTGETALIAASSSIVAFGSASNHAVAVRTNNTPAITIDTAQVCTFAAMIKPPQYTTAGRPAYVAGGVFFDTTLNKLIIGGASAWEAVASA